MTEPTERLIARAANAMSAARALTRQSARVRELRTLLHEVTSMRSQLRRVASGIRAEEKPAMDGIRAEIHALHAEILELMKLDE